jgi:hypothetical protein
MLKYGSIIVIVQNCEPQDKSYFQPTSELRIHSKTIFLLCISESRTAPLNPLCCRNKEIVNVKWVSEYWNEKKRERKEKERVWARRPSGYQPASQLFLALSLPSFPLSTAVSPKLDWLNLQAVLFCFFRFERERGIFRTSEQVGSSSAFYVRERKKERKKERSEWAECRSWSCSSSRPSNEIESVPSGG